MLVSLFSERYEVVPSILLFDLFFLYGKIKTICKGPVTLIMRILRGDTAKFFREKAEKFTGTPKRNETAFRNTAQFFHSRNYPEDEENAVRRIPKVTRAYIRISTQEKNKNGISLELQKKSILDFCSPRVPIFYEDIASAGSVNRPAYKKLLNELRPQDRLIVYRLDRLTRNSFDFADLWRGYIQRKKIRFVSVTERDNTTTADGMFQIKHRVNFADYEREIIRTRTREALAEKRKQGLVISRYIPYGYTRRGKHLVPIEKEQENIRLMKQGREEGLTYEFIARSLQRYKVPTKRKKVWRGYVVRDILRRQEKLSN